MPGLLFVIASMLVVGCDDGGAAKTRALPDVRPVVDGAPYLCDLVPEASLRRVTGVTAPLKSDWAGPQTDNGLCVVLQPKGPGVLGVQWSYNQGEKILRTQWANWAHKSHYKIPTELGRGLAGYDPSGGLDGLPNYVFALFRCRHKKLWISIDFARVVRGRDAVQDMFDFMRIAEKRFGEIHKCTPRPS
ncbi:hypothetical protein SAMN05443665_10551 [Actinomadura meyerae]|jgi:hypothetical protein|uniref:DUF3558 domain-containing protein n=1 Tax=Actinomadura meyerae TaxID=240840 RepID=A0A239NZR3_9ACTN|nr:hypothetical protein [Actinomadura meyerae]SNT59943.1 hypothetical protein SAMN05443665_10551 [Actinomadura meyerae]